MQDIDQRDRELLGALQAEIPLVSTPFAFIGQTLDLYKLETGRYPSSQEGLQALISAPPGVANWNGPIMTYRWWDMDRSPMFYWVYLDPRGVVQRAHPGMEFVNSPNVRD